MAGVLERRSGRFEGRRDGGAVIPFSLALRRTIRRPLRADVVDRFAGYGRAGNGTAGTVRRGGQGLLSKASHSDAE